MDCGTLHLEELFDGILTSDTAGAFKTDISTDGGSAFFHLYLSQQGLKRGEAVLIDDSEDVRVVESLGIDFLHVNESATLSDHLEAMIQSSKSRS